MATSTFAAWVWSLMVFLVPARAYDNAIQPPWLHESTAAYEARVKEMAEVIARVALDENEPPVAPVAHPRAFAAVALAVIGAGETGYARDTFHGWDGRPECYRGPGHEGRCDHGRSAGTFQVMVGAGKTLEGWTKADLFADFEKQTRAALHILRRSIAVGQRCGLGRAGWLNVYAGGQCSTGKEQGAARILRIFKLFGQGKWPNGSALPLVSDQLLARFEAVGKQVETVAWVPFTPRRVELPAAVGRWGGERVCTPDVFGFRRGIVCLR